ncbi:hypothetical protein B446_27620 [Streptomyces collinus Tu 365]|uniref:Ricin B lectin domain-containing protein n=1 Tax=Streptomyces collinus (strain DSM 40733 / Tue 365) TaxID=1214242 RepID=S5VP43_STRC3|nr:hypothetical protein B446_27620 [Streptomyces collinus Tu 365]
MYVIRTAVGGKVLDNPAAADHGVRQANAAAGRRNQQWRVVPVEGEASLCFIEAVTDETVLDLADPGEDGTRVILRAYDENAASQRWRFVTAAPERTSDLVLSWTPLGHWNGRRSWRLSRSAAVRPAPGAAPSFSDLLLVLERFGSDQNAGGWGSAGAGRPPNGQPGGWAGAGARFLADTTGSGRADVVGLKPAKGAVTASSRGDGTFDDEERVLHRPPSSPHPADLWAVTDMTGDGKPDAVTLCADGVRVSPPGRRRGVHAGGRHPGRQGVRPRPEGRRMARRQAPPFPRGHHRRRQTRHRRLPRRRRLDLAPGRGREVRAAPRRTGPPGVRPRREGGRVARRRASPVPRRHHRRRTHRHRRMS